MNLKKVPLVVQSKVAVNIVRPAEITEFAVVSQGSYLFLLALGSKEDVVILKEGQRNCTVNLVSILELLVLPSIWKSCPHKMVFAALNSSVQLERVSSRVFSVYKF